MFTKGHFDNSTRANAGIDLRVNRDSTVFSDPIISENEPNFPPAFSETIGGPRRNAVVGFRGRQSPFGSRRDRSDGRFLFSAHHIPTGEEKAQIARPAGNHAKRIGNAGDRFDDPNHGII